VTVAARRVAARAGVDARVMGAQDLAAPAWGRPLHVACARRV